MGDSMKPIKNVMIYLLFIFSSSTFARFTYVDIMNKTNDLCTLIDQRLLSGYQDTPTPTKIDKNTHQTFIIFQSLSRGPKIELTYSCNNKKVQFSCSQDTTLSGYGHLSAKLLSAPDGITANFHTVDPSTSVIGRIHVTLIEKSSDY